MPDVVVRVRAHPRSSDRLLAVVDLPDGVVVDERSVITDDGGRLYTLMERRPFEELAETAPFSDRRFVPDGRRLLVLPPDTTVLYLVR